jgi:hypothetical protein
MGIFLCQFLPAARTSCGQSAYIISQCERTRTENRSKAEDELQSRICYVVISLERGLQVSTGYEIGIDINKFSLG